jgi:hypothetical protein
MHPLRTRVSEGHDCITQADPPNLERAVEEVLDGVRHGLQEGLVGPHHHRALRLVPVQGPLEVLCCGEARWREVV